MKENQSIKSLESNKEGIYAHVLSPTWIPDYNKVLDIEFEPDIFQKQAFHLIGSGKSILVTAHTSSGKTLVAEYAIKLAQQNSSKTIYTSPIKALSNQKYYEFRQKFENVGIVTGDVQINSDGDCVIMTTEILRNILYKNALSPEVKYIIFDEVHYINDKERGVVWEECLIMIPSHVQLILLSATISNHLEFSNWIGRTKNIIMYIISTEKRVVPLEYYIYEDEKIYSTTGDINLKLCSDFMRKKIFAEKKKKTAEDECLNYFKRKKSAKGFSIVKLASLIVEKDMCPAIFFCFSKQRCDKIAVQISNLNLTTEEEKKEIRVIFCNSLSLLNPENLKLPQIKLIKDLTINGIGLHHSSLLPILKELVEILLSRNLIKILIATETFAMGVNMPTKTCVFLGITKIENESFRFLNASEFIQMSGRAGRRGKDIKGNVILAPNELLKHAVVKSLTTQSSTNLKSQFKLSFNVILCSIRLKIRVEDILKKSFSEDKIQRTYRSGIERLNDLKEELLILKKSDCDICNDLGEYLEDIKFICDTNHRLIKENGVLTPGMILMLKNNKAVKFTGMKNDDLLCETTSSYCNRNCDNLDVNKDGYLQYPHSVILRSSNLVVVKPEEIFIILNEEHFEYKIGNLSDVLVLNELRQRVTEMKTRNCIHCENFDTHYQEMLSHKLILNEMKKIEEKFSDENLFFLKEYRKKFQFLFENNYISGNELSVKGNMACEIKTVNEIFIVEMITGHKLKGYSGCEILALMSSLIFKEENEIEMSDRMKDGAMIFTENFCSLVTYLNSYDIKVDEKLNFNGVDAVLKWLSGISLFDISNMGIPEGIFVRLILRVNEIGKELVTAFEIAGNRELVIEIETALTLLKRDDIVLSSLYI